MLSAVILGALMTLYYVTLTRCSINLTEYLCSSCSVDDTNARDPTVVGPSWSEGAGTVQSSSLKGVCREIFDLFFS